MSTLQQVSSTPDVVRPVTRRVASIDIFRGLTMAVMIFVNELADVRGLPWWTYHAPAQVDVMTYVDMVFPFFLFAVGLSLPLSVAQRLRRNPSVPALGVHVLSRALALIVLGLILANAEKADQARMGMSGSSWAFLGLVSAALYLNVYPKSDRLRHYFRILSILGFVGVVVLLAIFRRTADDGQAAWLDGSYPEILGLIGFSYVAATILYVPTRRWLFAPCVWLVLLVGLCALSTARLIPFLGGLPLYFWPFEKGSMCCIIMAGVVTSLIFFRPERAFVPRRDISLALGFGLLLLAVGWALTPLGISKIRATPTWSLYSAGAAVLVFTLLYWICDVKLRTAWAALVTPAGSNTLLTYLLPDLWYFLLSAAGIHYLDEHWSLGWPGVVKTCVFTLLMLAIAGALTRAKVRLQL